MKNRIVRCPSRAGYIVSLLWFPFLLVLLLSTTNYSSRTFLLVDDHVNIPSVPLSSLIPDVSSLDHYYRYDGSLTTPPCFESVIWTVFKKTIRVTQTQVRWYYFILAFSSLLQSAEKVIPHSGQTEHECAMCYVSIVIK